MLSLLRNKLLYQIGVQLSSFYPSFEIDNRI